MNEMQEKLLDILKWFHAYCAEHGIRYFMIGGTMLGAVRHKGFIPWDDDVDVAVPRPDYEKLLAVARGAEQTGRYRLEAFSKKKDFVYPFLKVYDTETTLVECTRYNTRRGVYLDVFPLDGMGDTKEEGCRKFKKVQRMRYFLSAYTYSLRVRRARFRNLILALARCIPHSTYRLQKKIERNCLGKAFDTSAYAGNLLGGGRTREVMPREWYGTPVLYGFEDTELYGVADPDPYLTQLYGDYMTPPPPEQRIVVHNFIEMDLHRSYLDGPPSER